MTHAQLRALQAVVEEGTYHAASKKLFKSQPAISVLVKNLEEELNTQIFSRENYRPELTKRGQAIYQQASIVLRETTNLKILAKSFQNNQEPEVRIAINSVYPIEKLFCIFKELNRRFPATVLTLTSDMMGRPREKLMDGESDIAITYQSKDDLGSVEARYFGKTRIVPVSRADYGPATRDYNQLNDIRNDVQVVIADPTVSADKLTFDVLPNVRHWTVSNIESKKAVIMAGMGWGGLPEHVVAKEVNKGELKIVQVEGFEPRESTLYLHRRLDKPRGIVADAFWKELIDISHA